MLAILLSCLVAGPAYAAAGSDTLGPGERLNPGERITSGNGAYAAVMQSDGNFVLYGGARGVRWASGTNGNADPSFVIMQTDGNLVVYGVGEPKWWTRTSTPTGAARLVVQNDGNLVLYDGTVALWESGTGGETLAPAPAAAGPDTLSPGQQLRAGGRITSTDGRYFATMQDDGNFVVHGPTGWTWSTRTNGIGGTAFVTMQTDGNLVVYLGSTWKWQSQTKTPTGAARLVMQNDGNLVVYDGTVALWSSKDSAGVSAPVPTPAPAPAPTGTRAQLAQQVLGTRAITLATVHPSGVKDAANARQNIVDTAAGRKAARSAYGNAPGGTVDLDVRLLQALVAIGRAHTVGVSEIAGASHSVGSKHYAGRAIDIDRIDGSAVGGNSMTFTKALPVIAQCKAGGSSSAFLETTAGKSSTVSGNHVHCEWPA